jgi:lysyl-tRNA synthetase class 2
MCGARKVPAAGGRYGVFVLRLQRHRLGPRVYLLGVRLHEWHLGISILLALAVGSLTGLVHLSFATFLAAVAGVWLVAKDWRDLVRRSRDTAAWQLGLHRRPAPLRALRRMDAVPKLAAFAAAAAAIVNFVSAVTPNVAARGTLLVHVEPPDELRLFHAIAVPASVALLITAFYLYRRRLRALQLAVVLLVCLAVFNLLKGLDVEEAVVSFVAAGLLWGARRSFYVRHDPVTLRSAVVRIPLLLAASLFVCGLAIAIGAPAETSFATIVRETGDALLFRPGPVVFNDELGHLPLAIGLVGALTLLACGYLLFRPLAAPRDLPDAEMRRAATGLVRAHGRDTLAYFKLRRDEHYLFDPQRRAFLGYRIENRVLLVSGDPVGPEDAVRPLLHQLGAFAEHHGLAIAAIGVSETLRGCFEELGLRGLYLGDEAIIDTDTFTLEGRPIRKVRQSVSRLEKAGYRAELHHLAALDDATFAELERVAEAGRQGAPERGFAMALDALRHERDDETLVVLARDKDGHVRGFLHLVPTFGRRAVSLSLMRRDPRTPNGLMEFLVARAVELLRARGIKELSLNFAAFARIIHSPRGRAQRLLGRALAFADAFFQIESLYRFNAKFFPRWQPRYFMYERTFAFPRAGLAALWAEGQLPKPRPRRRPKRRVPTAARSSRRTTH